MTIRLAKDIYPFNFFVIMAAVVKDEKLKWVWVISLITDMELGGIKPGILSMKDRQVEAK